MKAKAVDFSGEIPRILIGYEGEPTDKIIINPDLSNVKKLPPHCWHLVDGKIIGGEPRNPSCKKRGIFKAEIEPKIIKVIERITEPKHYNSLKIEQLNKPWYEVAVIINLVATIGLIVITLFS